MYYNVPLITPIFSRFFSDYLKYYDIVKLIGTIYSIENLDRLTLVLTPKQAQLLAITSYAEVPFFAWLTSVGWGKTEWQKGKTDWFEHDESCDSEAGSCLGNTAGRLACLDSGEWCTGWGLEREPNTLVRTGAVIETKTEETLSPRGETISQWILIWTDLM